MSEEVTELPLPHDVTPIERETARRLIAKYTKVTGEEERAIRFAGTAIGQTGPIWRFQYLRMYRLPKGYLVAGHELRKGIEVGYADSAEELPRCFDHPGVREFIEDELRFRGVIGSEHAGA